jgi:hypothetical protein
VTAPPGCCAQPAQDHPAWRLWVSSTGRWWALRQTALTPAQITAGCRPLIYASDNPALTELISAQNELAKGSQPERSPGQSRAVRLGRMGVRGEVRRPV